MQLFYIFLGGGLGSVSRYGVSRLITSKEHINPMATISSNLLSVVILGALLYFFSRTHSLTANLNALLIVGFCGGFSTFSTFSYEVFEMIRQQQYLIAGLNILISLALGIFVLFLFAKNM